MEEKEKSEHYYTPLWGGVCWFDPLGKAKVDESNLILMLSNELHNRLSDHLVVALVVVRNDEEIIAPLEVHCELEGKKLKVLISRLFTISKSGFYKHQKYLGRLDEKIMKKVTEKIKLILNLDN